MTCPNPNHIKYEQSIRNRGQWLIENETTLKAVQSYLGSKFWEAYEQENSDDLDSFLVEIEDHVLLLVKVIASLRTAEFWPKDEPVAAETAE